MVSNGGAGNRTRDGGSERPAVEAETREIQQEEQGCCPAASGQIRGLSAVSGNVPGNGPEDSNQDREPTYINGSYAQIGYEAYRAESGGTTFDGRPMPTWEDLAALPHGARTRRLWGAAATAILAAVPKVTLEQQTEDEAHAYLDRCGVPRRSSDEGDEIEWTLLERVEMLGSAIVALKEGDQQR